MNSRPIYIFLLLFTLVEVGLAQVHEVPNSGNEELILPITELEIVEDKSGEIELSHILNGEVHFAVYSSFEPSDFNIGSSYWVKMPLDLADGGNRWLIEFYDQTIDNLEIYSPDGEGGYQRIIMGDQYPFYEKTLQHKNFEVFVDPQLVGVQIFYFRVKSHTPADVRIAIRSVSRFIHYSLIEYFLYGIFYGMIVIVSLYNLLIFSAIREIKYLYYTFYLLSVAVYAMCVDGIAYQFLWPNMPEWNQIAYGTALFLLIFWALVFGQQFLNTKVRAKKLNKIISVVLVLRTALYLYAVLFDHSVFEWRNIEILPLSLTFYAGIHVWLKGYKPARFFVMAYGVLFLGFLIKALLNLSIIPFYILSYYSLHVCFLLEMLFLTFALSDRVRILKANRDRAVKRIVIQHQENVSLKDKVNKDLERLVNERTREIQEKNLLLEETNQKLYQQTTEINRINSMLDLDNWKLKNNVKEVLQDRLINKNLTIEEFNKIFTDKISCYRFLDRLKWENGFVCTKCENTKYSDGHIIYSRRCSKCGYDESVTSNTIFHNIKFPIQKAFYILYVTNNRQNKYTLDELSEMLHMRRNTVWNFRKKIEKVFAQNHQSSLVISDLFTSHLN